MRGTDEIERMAEGWRKALDPEDEWAPHVMRLLEKAAKEFKHTSGLSIRFRPDSEMVDHEARAETDPPTIFVRESLAADAEANRPRIRSTLIHELAHVILHPGVPKFRKHSGATALVVSRRWEAEAWSFARAFLMPSWKVAQVESAEALALRSRVSLYIAKIRYERSSRASTSRPELPEVRTLLDTLKKPPAQKTEEAKSRKQTAAQLIWETLPLAPGEDPAQYRLCSQRTYLVAWAEFDRFTQCGWFLVGGRVVAAISIDRP